MLLSKIKGFTLLEILIVLSVMSLVTLLFFNQYWQINNLLNRIILKNSALNYLNNSSERIQAHMEIKKDHKFHLQIIPQNNGIYLITSYKALHDEHSLKRYVVVNEQ